MRILALLLALAPLRARADEAVAAAADGAQAVGAQAPALQERFSQLLQAASLDPSPVGLLLVALLIGLLPFALAPMTLLCLLAAAALPPLKAAPVMLGGLLLNTALAWGLARTVVGARLEAWLERRGGALAAVRRGARANGLKWAILCRFLPAPFITQPMVLATTGVGLGTTVLGTGIAMSPWVGVYIWVAKAGRQGSLRSLGLAAAGAVAVYLLAGYLRRRFAAPPAAPAGPLAPRDPGKPTVLLYSVPGHELSDDARAELAELRERLGFEVDERVLGPGADEGLRARYEDHAPVALFNGEKLFNFKMDENVLRVRLDEWRRRQGVA